MGYGQRQPATPRHGKLAGLAAAQVQLLLPAAGQPQQAAAEVAAAQPHAAAGAVQPRNQSSGPRQPARHLPHPPAWTHHPRWPPPAGTASAPRMPPLPWRRTAAGRSAAARWLGAAPSRHTHIIIVGGTQHVTCNKPRYSQITTPLHPCLPATPSHNWCIPFNTTHVLQDSKQEV